MRDGTASNNIIADIAENAIEKSAENSEKDLEDIAPIQEKADDFDGDYAPLTAEEAEARDKERSEAEEPRVARILTEESPVEKKEGGKIARILEKIVDKGFVFENLAKKTKNRELEAKWNSTRYAEGLAQDFIGKGTKDLNDRAKMVYRSTKI